MRARHLLLCLSMLAFHAGPAIAFDPRTAAILGLHLGMCKSDLLDALAVQGVAAIRIQQEAGPCAIGDASRCVRTLRAPTRDGRLLVLFIARAGPGSETVQSIAYTFNGRGVGEPAMIRRAVLDHFGPPTSNDPPAWCAQVDALGACPPDQPRLTFVEGPDTSSTLTLSDAAAPGGMP